MADPTASRPTFNADYGRQVEDQIVPGLGDSSYEKYPAMDQEAHADMGGGYFTSGYLHSSYTPAMSNPYTPAMSNPYTSAMSNSRHPGSGMGFSTEAHVAPTDRLWTNDGRVYPNSQFIGPQVPPSHTSHLATNNGLGVYPIGQQNHQGRSSLTNPPANSSHGRNQLTTRRRSIQPHPSSNRADIDPQPAFNPQNASSRKGRGQQTRELAKKTHKFHCDEHDRSFGSMCDLQRHFTDTHKTDPAGNPIQGFKCGCGRVFRRKANLRNHERTQHNGRETFQSRTGKEATNTHTLRSSPPASGPHVGQTIPNSLEDESQEALDKYNEQPDQKEMQIYQKIDVDLQELITNYQETRKKLNRRLDKSLRYESELKKRKRSPSQGSQQELSGQDSNSPSEASDRDLLERSRTIRRKREKRLELLGSQLQWTENIRRRFQMYLSTGEVSSSSDPMSELQETQAI